MSHSNRPLIGSVFERKPSALSAANHPKLSGSSHTGFPVVQHRSKSAFARGRDELKRNGSVGPTRTKDVPLVQHANNGGGRISGQAVTDPDDLRRQISEENEKRVESMTEEERDQERREIIEQFGGGVGDLLKKAREARQRRLAREQGVEADKTHAIQVTETDGNAEQEKTDSSSEGTSFDSMDIF